MQIPPSKKQKHPVMSHNNKTPKNLSFGNLLVQVDVTLIHTAHLNISAAETHLPLLSPWQSSSALQKMWLEWLEENYLKLLPGLKFPTCQSNEPAPCWEQVLCLRSQLFWQHNRTTFTILGWSVYKLEGNISFCLLGFKESVRQAYPGYLVHVNILCKDKGVLHDRYGYIYLMKNWAVKRKLLRQSHTNCFKATNIHAHMYAHTPNSTTSTSQLESALLLCTFGSTFTDEALNDPIMLTHTVWENMTDRMTRNNYSQSCELGVGWGAFNCPDFLQIKLASSSNLRAVVRLPHESASKD